MGSGYARSHLSGESIVDIGISTVHSLLGKLAY